MFLLLLSWATRCLFLVHLVDLFLNSLVFLLNLSQFLVLLFASLVIPFELGSKRRDLLLPYTQVFIQGLQLELLVLTVSSFLDRVTLHVVLLLQLLDRFLKSKLVIQLVLVLGFPTNRHSLLISGTLGSESFQLFLQLTYHILVYLNLLLAILDLFFADA